MFFVVPVKSDSDVSCSRPIGGDFVVALECLLEVLSVLFTNVFDPKIVHHQRELDRLCVILLEPGHNFALTIAMLVESFFEEFVG